MKKILLWSLGGLLVLGLGAFVVLTFFLGGIVKAGINEYGPKMTLTPVVLGGASLSPLSGSGALTGLNVGNPPGWKNDQAFTLGSIHLSIAPFSIFGDHIVINELIIDQPQFDYETRLVESNVSQLLANIQKASGSGAATPTSKSGQPVKFELKKFRITNARISVGVGGLAAIPVPMPDLALDNLGSDQGGITADQLVTEVMKHVTTGIIAAGKDVVLNGGKAVVGGATAAVGGAVDTAKGAVSGLKSLLGGSGSK